MNENNSSRGVTLIEMVVVVGIIGIIVAVSLPSAASGIDSVRLSSAAGSIASFLNAAVNRTERRQIPMEVEIDAAGARLALYSAEPNYTRELKLPDGIAIEAVLAAKTEEQNTMQSGPYRLLLIPGAATPGIGIRIANHHGSWRIVRLDPMTGYPHVEGPAGKK